MKNKKWMKAKAVKVKEEEYQKEIKNKLKEKIQLQQNYMEALLIKNNKMAKLISLDKELKKAEGLKVDTMGWLGVDYPVLMLSTEYDLELFYYKRAKSNVEYFLKALRNIGMTGSDIEQIEKGVYIKDEELLDKMSGKVKVKAKSEEYFG